MHLPLLPPGFLEKVKLEKEGNIPYRPSNTKIQKGKKVKLSL
jgi:hypothetical protein